MRLFFLLATIVVCASASGTPMSMADEGADETHIKAAMLFKFLSYTEWPPNAFATEDSPYHIWVLGDHGVGSVLRDISENRVINGRPVDVTVADATNLTTAPHVIFVGHDASKRLATIRRMADQQGVLIVTENPKGIKKGSMINLRLVEGRVGFDVSLVDAQKANIHLSARLLTVASSVKK